MKKEILFSYRGEGVRIHHTLTEKPSTDNFAFQSHSHNMYEIFLFLNGDGDFVVEGNAIHLERGTLVFTLSGQTHNLLLKSSELPYERIAIMFAEKHFPKHCESLLQRAAHGGCVSNLSENEINWFLESLNIFCNGDEENIVHSLAESLINLAVHKVKGSSVASKHFDDTEDDLVKQVIRYIDRHFGEEISLDSIEKSLYRDKAYLGRKFKAVMGCSIWEYVIRKRIFSAREQLYLTKSVSDAFLSSGFKDYSAFYRKYKKYVGASPAEDLKQLTE